MIIDKEKRKRIIAGIHEINREFLIRVDLTAIDTFDDVTIVALALGIIEEVGRDK